MNTKNPGESLVEATHLVMPPDANPYGNCFGGTIMGWMDMAAGIAAWKHSNKPSVTVAIDNICFTEAIHIGDIVTVRAQVDFAGKTSMEVGVTVNSQDTQTGEKKHCLDGHFTFVALDEYGKPTEVPAIAPVTAKHWIAYNDAEERRKNRKKVSKT